LTVALGDLAHREDRPRVEPVCLGECELPQTIDRNIGVLVQSEKVLDGHEPADQRLRLARVQVSEELERVTEALAADSQSVIVACRRFGADAVSGLAHRSKARLDEVWSERESWLRGGS
jgi:hypothetical protein